MASGAQLSVTDNRRSTRYPVARRCLGEHRRLGEIDLHLANVSTSGFMTAQPTGLSLGERVIIRLPHVGRIEAHLMWAMDERAGFQFERIIRDDDFAVLIEAMQGTERLRPN